MIMSSKKNRIIVDIEKMRYKYTGLYNYCDNLKNNLLLYGADDFDFTFFVCKSMDIEKGIKIKKRNFIKKFFLKPPFKYKIWHTTFQNTKFFPLGPIKIVYTIHDLNFLYECISEKEKKQKLKKIQKRIDKADCVTVISNYVLNDVKKNLSIDAGKQIKVIYNGVDLRRFPKFDTPRYLPSNDFLLSMGTIMRKKNFHILPSLLTGNKLELLIAGRTIEKKYKEVIIDQCLRFKVLERVVFLGEISEQEKYWYINNCKAFVFPSIAEGFGLPPVEAMMLGKPVFLSNLTSLPEIGGEYAYYFKSFDPENMRSVLQKGLRDYVDQNKKDSIIKWAQRYSWKTSSQQYLKLYKEMIT